MYYNDFDAALPGVSFCLNDRKQQDANNKIL